MHVTLGGEERMFPTRGRARTRYTHLIVPHATKWIRYCNFIACMGVIVYLYGARVRFDVDNISNGNIFLQNCFIDAGIQTELFGASDRLPIAVLQGSTRSLRLHRLLLFPLFVDLLEEEMDQE